MIFPFLPHPLIVYLTLLGCFVYFTHTHRYSLKNLYLFTYWPNMSSPSIILTGASKGLGLAILKILSQRHNARVTTLSRSYTEDLKAIVEEYGPDRVVVVQGDIGNAEDNARVVKAAIDAFGQLDGLILNAASLEPFAE